MNENMTLVLFEELKASLSVINTRLQSISTRNNTSKEIDEYDPQFERVYDEFRALDGNLTYLIKEKSTEIVQCSQLNGTRAMEILESNIAEHFTKLKIKHTHTLDVQSSKTPLIIVTLVVSLFLSLYGIFTLYNENSRLEDNDWKYRYIKSIKGINKQQLGVMENVFYYNRNEERIQELKDDVIKYELALERKSQNLEMYELKE